MKKASSFRLWVHNIWLDNNDEQLAYKELPYTMQEYWSKYKWWLRREFKHQETRKN